MFSRIRSALFIDFENMPLARDSIENWLAWLEDGAFDGGRRRRFVLKRVYWNSGVQKFESAYKASGFEVMLCGRYHGLANSVDVQMAIDIIETTYQQPRIDEYILITRDTDFVPVLRRLREKQKRTAFMVHESKLNVHTTYRQHADVLIPVRALDAARRYERRKRGLLARLITPRKAKPEQSKPNGAAAPKPAVTRPAAGGSAANGAAKAPPAPVPAAPTQVAAATPEPPKPTRPKKAVVKFDLPSVDATRRGLERAVTLAATTPNRTTSRARMIKALQDVPEFTTSGRSPFLGYGDYKSLMVELSRLDPRLTIVEQPEGGMVVRFEPKPETPPARPVPVEEHAEPKAVQAKAAQKQPEGVA